MVKEFRSVTQCQLLRNITINSFSDRYFHELDTVNFLDSGKEWYGEEFSNMPGQTVDKKFSCKPS